MEDFRFPMRQGMTLKRSSIFLLPTFFYQCGIGNAEIGLAVLPRPKQSAMTTCMALSSNNQSASTANQLC
jgi:hypothetical protein